MNRGDALEKYCATGEERLLGAKLFDKDGLAKKTWAPQHTQFLSPAESRFARRFCEGAGLNAVFDGGYEGAERTVALFCPEGVRCASPLCAVRFAPARGALSAPTHRDYLGALLSLGIVRGVIGDITLNEGGAVAAVLPEVVEFILQNMDRAGKAALIAERAELSDLRPSEDEGKEVRGTVASLRLDCAVGEAFGLSREKAKALCASGAVAQNHVQVTAPDKAVAEGDVISVRGKGRAVLESAGLPTKKGHIPVVIRVFR